MVLSRVELDKAQCTVPGCSHQDHDSLFLNARCHPRQGTEVEYREGILYIRCQVCKEMVTEILVAPAALQ